LLRSDGDDGLTVGIELDVEAPAVPVADGDAQLVDAARHGVAMVLRLLRRLDQALHDVRWGRAVGIAHREVDDVLAGASRCLLEVADDVEDVRGKPLYARELHASARVAHRASPVSGQTAGWGRDGGTHTHGGSPCIRGNSMRPPASLIGHRR